MVNAQLVWSSGMTSLSHGHKVAVEYREDPGFDPQHEHCFVSFCFVVCESSPVRTGL
jgi:hypothetical protein